jgi:hypothetical protein
LAGINDFAAWLAPLMTPPVGASGDFLALIEDQSREFLF